MLLLELPVDMILLSAFQSTGSYDRLHELFVQCSDFSLRMQVSNRRSMDHRLYLQRVRHRRRPLRPILVNHLP